MLKKNLKFMFITGNVIMMLCLLKNTTFSTAIHRTSDIIKDGRTKFETSDTPLLDALCDANTERRNYVKQVFEMALEKKSRLTLSIVIKLPLRRNEQNSNPQLGMYSLGFAPVFALLSIYTHKKFLLSYCSSYLCMTFGNIVFNKSALIGC